MSGTPYTFMDHARRCIEAAHGRSVLVQFVQIQRGQAVMCGKIRDAITLDEGIDLWRVETIQPRSLVSVRPSRVRQCSGLDGRCTCALNAGGVAAASEARSHANGEKGAECL